MTKRRKDTISYILQNHSPFLTQLSAREVMTMVLQKETAAVRNEFLSPGGSFQQGVRIYFGRGIIKAEKTRD